MLKVHIASILSTVKTQMNTQKVYLSRFMDDMKLRRTANTLDEKKSGLKNNKQPLEN